jgi:prepilin-type N-terminal cleavage/methylation domain-containing protein
MKRTAPQITAPSLGQKCGFTLIELLTVIAIIGVLAGILIPVITIVRTRAMESGKMSTYRQYFIANGLYANDHKGNTCPAKDSRGEDKLWQRLLAPYLIGDTKYSNKSDIYFDPFYGDYDPDQSYLTGAGINVKVKLPDSNVDNAFWNDVTIANGSDCKLSQITEPGKRVFVGDSTDWFINSKMVDATRHDEGTTGMFVRFDGSIVMLTEAEAILAVTDPAKL